jgi:hypothetical protein
MVTLTRIGTTRQQATAASSLSNPPRRMSPRAPAERGLRVCLPVPREAWHADTVLPLRESEAWPPRRRAESLYDLTAKQQPLSYPSLLAVAAGVLCGRSREVTPHAPQLSCWCLWPPGPTRTVAVAWKQQAAVARGTTRRSMEASRKQPQPAAGCRGGWDRERIQTNPAAEPPPGRLQLELAGPPGRAPPVARPAACSRGPGWPGRAREDPRAKRRGRRAGGRARGGAGRQLAACAVAHIRTPYVLGCMVEVYGSVDLTPYGWLYVLYAPGSMTHAATASAWPTVPVVGCSEKVATVRCYRKRLTAAQ